MQDDPDRDVDGRHLQRILDGMGDGLYVLDAAGEVIEVNDYLVDLIGHDRDAIVGADPEAFHRATDVAAFEEAIADLLSDDRQTVKTVQATLETAEGEVVPIEVNFTIRRDDSGTFRGTVGVVRDVTDQRERERELERYETIVRTIPDAVVVLDTDGHHVMINNLGRTGYSRDELLGEHFSMTTPPEDVERAEEIAAEVILNDDREKATFEQQLITKDGTHIPHETHLAALPPDDDGMVPGVVAVLRDISERREYEKTLERQNERLEEFASVVSHDLRNPLNVAQGTLEILAEDCESDAIPTIEEAHERMARIIEDTLTLARQGRTVGETEPVELGTLAAACWRTVPTDGATMAVEGDPVVRADVDRLRHLLENLFRNAIEHGGPEVTVRIGPIDGGFYVADDGPGIPAADRAAILEAGYSTTDTGTGFGLAIVKRIAEAHGWSMAVDDNPGGGARFEFTGVDTT